jgi:uncharacterized protein YkwD
VARRAVVLVSLITLGLVSLGPGTARTAVHGPTALTALEEGVLDELNTVRSTHGLAPLKANPQLDAAAYQHSSEMVAKGYFAHESADGSDFWKRIRRFYAPQRGVWSVGENLLWASAGINPRKAVELWMASPGHRKNILTANWREIGIGAVSATASGEFGGRPVTVITTDFGVRH